MITLIATTYILFNNLFIEVYKYYFQTLYVIIMLQSDNILLLFAEINDQPEEKYPL